MTKTFPFRAVEKLVGAEDAAELRRLTLAIYRAGGRRTPKSAG